jgi:hypothetical protein
VLKCKSFVTNLRLLREMSIVDLLNVPKDKHMILALRMAGILYRHCGLWQFKISIQFHKHRIMVLWPRAMKISFTIIGFMAGTRTPDHPAHSPVLYH